MARFLIEGEWVGYRSSQDKVVHREITTDKKFADRVDGLYSITYTDGTSLRLTMRPLKSGEKVKEPMKNGYGSLIRDCVRYGVNTVADLMEAKAGGKP